MPRPSASAPPEAIRIEDEVWQEAFTRREPARQRRLQAIDGGRPAPAPTRGRPAPAPTRARPAGLPVASPRTAAARRPPEPPGLTAVSAVAELPAPVVGREPASRHASELPSWQDGPSPGALGGVPGRRTVTIRGHGAERNLPWPEASRRRPPRRAYERAGFQPDRVAMWAVLLGILLVVVAVASAHG